MNNPDNWKTHTLFENGDPDAPGVIRDRNGDIALRLCKHCGRAEAELAEPCDAVTSPHAELIALLKEIRPNYGDVGTRDVDVAAQRSRIDKAIRMLVKLPAPPGQRDWHEYQRIADLPEVFDVLHDFSQDPTGDNGVMVVQAVLEAVANQGAK